MTQQRPDGSVRQAGLTVIDGDYQSQRLNYPVVGVVLAVHFSDDPYNATAIAVADQRGRAVTVDVLVVNHGSDGSWFIPNVKVLPTGPSGVDDYYEAIPRPCAGMIDGSQFSQGMLAVDVEKLDGDWIVVQFVGGSIDQPIMTGWYPHPGNSRDPATAGFPITSAQGQRDAGTLEQGRRLFSRYAGLKTTITAEGSLFVDTNESNAIFSGSQSGIKRDLRDAGGDVQLDVKPQRKLEVNFNAPIPLPRTQPSLPQPNPPQGEQTRKTDRTTITLDKDTLHLLAGKIVELLTSDDYIDLHAKTKIRMRGDDGNNSILLGSTDPANCDHAVRGEPLRTLLNALIDAFVSHQHKTPFGLTDTPSAPFTDRMTDAQLSLPVMVTKS